MQQHYTRNLLPPLSITDHNGDRVATPLVSCEGVPASVRDIIYRAASKLSNKDTLDLLVYADQYPADAFATKVPLCPAAGQCFIISKPKNRDYLNDGHQWNTCEGGKIKKQSGTDLKIESEKVLKRYYDKFQINADWELHRHRTWRIGSEDTVIMHYFYKQRPQNRTSTEDEARQEAEQQDQERPSPLAQAALHPVGLYSPQAETTPLGFLLQDESSTNVLGSALDDGNGGFGYNLPTEQEAWRYPPMPFWPVGEVPPASSNDPTFSPCEIDWEKFEHERTTWGSGN